MAWRLSIEAKERQRSKQLEMVREGKKTLKAASENMGVRLPIREAAVQGISRKRRRRTHSWGLRESIKQSARGRKMEEDH